MDVFDLFAKISLDSSEYEGKLSKAGENFKNVGNGIKSAVSTVVKVTATAMVASAGAIAGVGTAVWSAANKIAELGDEIDKESQKLQINSELYQQLQYACERSGTSIDSLKRGIVNITDKMSDVKNGVEGASENFDKLGIKVKNADGTFKSTETVLMETINKLSDMTDETERNATAQDMFGKSYTEILPLLNSGSAGISELLKEASDYGMVIGQDTVSASAAFEDSLLRLKNTFAGTKNSITGSFLPSITMIMDGFSDLIAGNDKAGDEIKKGLDSLIKNIETAVPQFVNVVKTIGSSVISVIPEIVTSFSNEIIVNAPIVYEKIKSVFEQGIKKLSENKTEVAGVVKEVAQFVFDGVATVADDLLNSLPDVFNVAAELLQSSDGEILSMVLDTIFKIGESIINNADGIIDSVISFIEVIANNIVNNIPIIAEKAPEIIIGLATKLVEHAPDIYVASVKIIVALAKGIINSIPTLIDSALKAYNEFKNSLMTSASKLFDIGKVFIDKILSGINATKNKLINSAKTWGKDLMDNFINGINDKIQALKDNISGVAQLVRDFVGFSEPDKGPLSNFHTYAPDMMDLFMQGIDDNKNKLLNTVSSAFDFKDLITSPSTVDIGANVNADITKTSGSVFDYTTLANAIVGALDGFTVSMDGERIGKLINNQLSVLKTRGAYL